MSRFTKKLLFFFALCLLSGTLLLTISKKGLAVTAADWRPGYIIDDDIFYNNNAMSANDIQAFLNARVPVCDTSGTKIYSGNTTRAQYSASRGYHPPFICLKDYVENPSNHVNNLNGQAVPGGWSAAQIIEHAGDSYGINPKVLLTLLQKEQVLIADDWPWPNQYRTATGYGCPDTAVCDSQYYGLYNQVMNAARQFRNYANNPSAYRYKPYRNNIIYFNPGPYNNAAGRYYGRFGTSPDIEYCGATDVYIQNLATAALYNYTPYQPNQSALNNMNGSGDMCGAYGNRNFWRIFNDWFGSTVGGCQSNEVSRSAISRTYNTRTYNHFYTSYDCEIKIAVNARGEINEGAAFYQARPNDSGMTRIHRLYNPRTRMHLWTASQADIDSAIRYGGYWYEGVAFYGVANDVVSPGAVRIHRLYNPRTFMHLWTASQADIDSAIRYGGYWYEGVAFYAYSTPQF